MRHFFNSLLVFFFLYIDLAQAKPDEHICANLLRDMTNLSEVGEQMWGIPAFRPGDKGSKNGIMFGLSQPHQPDLAATAGRIASEADAKAEKLRLEWKELRLRIAQPDATLAEQELFDQLDAAFMHLVFSGQYYRETARAIEQPMAPDFSRYRVEMARAALSNRDGPIPPGWFLANGRPGNNSSDEQFLTRELTRILLKGD